MTDRDTSRPWIDPRHLRHLEGAALEPIQDQDCGGYWSPPPSEIALTCALAAMMVFVIFWIAG